MSLYKVTIVILILGSAAACKSTESATSENATSDANVKDTSHLEEIYWARIDSSRMAFVDADVDFMVDMIGHHAQALIIAQLALENDASAEINRLASRIINAQHDEIESMQQWLRERDQDVPEIHIEGINLMIHGLNDSDHSDHTDMPGMLTQDQLEELAEARNSEFNRLFLEYMIEHHQGAVTMVRDLFNTDGAALEDGIFRLASDIQVDQITEIQRMKQMLKNLSDS